MGFAKEYHIHDALTLPECSRFRDRTLRQVRALKRKGEAPVPGSKLAHRFDFLTRPESYYLYFASVVRRDGITLTGDFTPSYSGLSVETLARLRDEIMAQGLHPKVVFLMRDPVERSWSALRMSRRQTALKNPDHVFETDEFEQLRQTYDQANYVIRGDYGQTLDRLYDVFGVEDIFLEFYETLFRQDVIDRLCDFSGIPRIDADLKKQVNVSPKTSHIPDEIAGEIALYYRDVYHALADRYGAARILDLWWSARFVLEA